MTLSTRPPARPAGARSTQPARLAPRPKALPPLGVGPFALPLQHAIRNSNRTRHEHGLAAGQFELTFATARGSSQFELTFVRMQAQHSIRNCFLHSICLGVSPSRSLVSQTNVPVVSVANCLSADRYQSKRQIVSNGNCLKVDWLGAELQFVTKPLPDRGFR